MGEFSRRVGVTSHFVTIVLKHRARDFGSVIDGRMVLSGLGKAAEDCWSQIPDHHKEVELDAFVIMPDHMHGILMISPSCGDDFRERGVQLNARTEFPFNARTEFPFNARTEFPFNARAEHSLDARLFIPSNAHTMTDVDASSLLSLHMSAISPAKGTISVVIRTYKAAVTTWARRNGFSYFAWQSKFYDMMIHSDRELDRIRQYIANNPTAEQLRHRNLQTHRRRRLTG